MGRFPSELAGAGSGYRLRIKANGILGRWLSFEGEIEDLKPPVMWSEFLDMIGLYHVEKEEAEEAQEQARREMS